MALEDVLAGVGGALKGGADAYSWQKEYQQKDRAIDTQKENAVLRAQVQEMIARLNAGSREKIAGEGNVTKVDVANIGADSRRDVATTNQEGATARNNVNAGVTTRGQNLNFTLGTDRNDTNLFGIKTRSRDSRYATDTGANTTRRGQDISAETGRRGQDLNYSLGTERNDLTERGQDLDFTLDTSAESGRNARARAALRARPGAGLMGVQPRVSEVDNAPITGEDVNLSAPRPAPVPARRGTIPVTPRGGAAVAPIVAPPPAPAGVAAAPVATDPAAGVQEPVTQLALKATALITQSRAEKDPAKKAALQAQLAQIREQILALRKGAK